MPNPKLETMGNFAKLSYELLLSDRDLIAGVGGFTGEGKSCFSSSYLKHYSEVSRTYWGFDRMTWSRKELMDWVDGKHRLAEYNAILPDELWAMFYKRNWYDKDQIDAIGTFNMCRDRHLLLCGNIPNFWELDVGFTNRVRFYIYIPQRGIAWVFEQENNPFSNDRWNARENCKLFRKRKNPYSSPNFICEIHFEDWTPEEKAAYYHVRNEKRRLAMVQNKNEQQERYHRIKEQRDVLLRLAFKDNDKLTNQDIADLTGMSNEAVRLIREGLR